MKLENILWFIVISIQLIIIFCLLIRFMFIKMRSRGKEKYWEDTPDDLPPFAACALLEEKGIFDNCLAAEIAYFIYKGMLKPLYNNGNLKLQILRSPNANDKLWSYQIMIFRSLIQNFANSDGVVSYDNLTSSKVGVDTLGIIFTLTSELKEKGYYNSNLKTSVKDKIIIAIVISIFIWFYICLNNMKLFLDIMMIPVIILAVIMIILSKNNLYKKLSPKGKQAFNNWASFRAFLRNYGKFEDRGTRDIIIWRKFLVYACAFDLSDKLEDEVDDLMTKEIIMAARKALLNIGIGIVKGLKK